MAIQERTFEPLFAKSRPDVDSSSAYRQLIGFLGFILPFVLVWVADLRPTRGLAHGKLLSSLSAYYYTGSVAAFVGLLVALGIFLYTYKGYKNKYGRRDRLASRIAGAAAVFVAAFPTQAPLESLAPSWWRPVTGVIHFSAAAVLFLSFSYFSLFLFTKTTPGRKGPLPGDKKARNVIYIFCGVMIPVSIAWAGIAAWLDAPIFVPESLALMFFAASWLTKGRIDRTAAGLVQRTMRLFGR